MLNKSSSPNYQTLKEITSKSRTARLSYDAQYMVIYAFLYKYCSDSLKDHFISELQTQEVTLDEAYKIGLVKSEFKRDADNMFGYFIEKPDAFFDEVMNNHFTSKDFFTQFFKSFTENVTFEGSPGNEKYFKELFDTVQESFNFNIDTTDPEGAQILKDIIYSISKLDIFDTGFTFSDVFSSLADSRLIRVESNPEYIYQVLSAIINSQNRNLGNVYDPFMKDGTSFLYLSHHRGPWNSNYYGKEADRLTYLFGIARLFLKYYSFDNLFVENGDAVDSIDINQASFDTILSVIPIKIRNYHTSKRNQSLEIAKRHKRAELESLLTQNFDMDFNSLAHDAELSKALEKLINRMDVESETSSQFSGEYEILAESEFLFLINLINSLKEDGIMAVSISQNFLNKDSLKTLRKYLTYEKNCIDAIISVPNEFGRYKRPEVVIVFRKDKQDKNIHFIDMSMDFDTTRTRLTVPGRFKRNILLSAKTIDRMLDALHTKSSIEKYSQLIGIGDIESNDFNLSVSKYVDTFEGDFIDLESLVREKKEIDHNRHVLADKITRMMHELGINFDY